MLKCTCPRAKKIKQINETKNYFRNKQTNKQINIQIKIMKNKTHQIMFKKKEFERVF